MNEKRIKYLNNTLNDQISARIQQQKEVEFAQKQTEERKNTAKLSFNIRQTKTSNSEIQLQNNNRTKENNRAALLQRMNDRRKNSQLSA